MKTIKQLLFLAFFLFTLIVDAQVTMGIREENPGSTPHELVLFYSFGADYNSGGENFWNSQLVTLRYSTDLPSPATFIANLTDENCFGWSQFPVGTCGDDHYIIFTDPDVATCAFSNGDIVDVLTIRFDNTTTPLATADFELVPADDACLAGFGFGAPAINNGGTGANEFAGFSPGTVNGLILPVKLRSFSATIINCQSSEITWETEEEQDNDFFTIERSVNAKDWTTIAHVPSVGSSAKYSSKDNYLPGSKIIFYRLKQTDFDGTETMLGIRSIRNDCSTILVDIYPNPTANFFTIEGEGINGTYKITDVFGQFITSGQITEFKTEIDISIFPDGLYIVTINQEGNNEIVKRVLKQ